MREIRFKLSGMVLKTERELVLEKESTMRISTKRKGVCGTHERRRERERYEVAQLVRLPNRDQGVMGSTPT